MRRRTPFFVVAALFGLSACSGVDDGKPPEVTMLDVPASAGSRVPHLSPVADGSVVMSWLQTTATGVSLQWSVLQNGRWQAAAEIARGDDWFVNWADFPSVTPITGQLWAAHWLRKKPGGAYAYDVVASLSNDAGQTWDEPFVVHDDDSATEHGFVTLFPWQGQTNIVWLDGRNTKPGAGHHHHGGGMTLRSARFDADANVVERVEIDALVCDCCQTDVAVSAAGPVAVYRNRTEDEIRDIHVTRYVNGQWQSDRPVADDGWQIAGCPVNGPAIAAHGSDIAVSWFTAARDELKIRLARSSDNGETFGEAVDMDSGAPTGRVDVIQHASGSSLVSWIRESDEGRSELVVRAVERSGRMGRITKVANLSSGRISGFPQMEWSGDDVVFAWTDTENGITRIRSAVADLEQLLRI